MMILTRDYFALTSLVLPLALQSPAPSWTSWNAINPQSILFQSNVLPTLAGFQQGLEYCTFSFILRQNF